MIKFAIFIMGAVVLGAVALCPCVSAQPPHAPSTRPATVEMAPAKTLDKSAQETLLIMLDAIEANDYANFARHASDEFKETLTQKEFTRAVDLAAARLEKGYTVVYFGEMIKAPYTIHLWKLVFQDKGADLLGEFSLKDDARDKDKVDNFFLH